ncbi:MAG TPA: hypothetical protein VH575_25640, partial [Gemmataceae bacterium]
AVAGRQELGMMAEMPLAVNGGGVASGLQDLGDGLLLIADAVAAGRAELQRFAVAGSEVVSAFSLSGRFVVTGASLKHMARGPKAEESAVRVWEIATGKEVASFQGHQSSITAVAFAPDGKSLASGGGDSTILIWDLVGQLRHGQRRQPLPAAEL